ncbi:MAG: hypothetical protein O3A93_04790, partial [Chloroflexi bacterium]|nr:hypothetical protein [Chloroflexota bacterium]
MGATKGNGVWKFKLAGLVLLLAVACGSTSTSEDVDKLVAEGVQSAVARLPDTTVSQASVLPPTPTPVIELTHVISENPGIEVFVAEDLSPEVGQVV